jgi:DNA-binding transcriptional LysR family regulator
MCLLKGMRGRQLLDDALATRDLEVKPRLESDSVMVLLTHVGTGRWATILPQTWIRALRPAPGVSVLRLDNPLLTARVGLVTNAGQRGSVLTRALVQTARSVGVNDALRAPPMAVDG